MEAKNLKPYTYYKRITMQDEEANTIVTYGDPIEFTANIYPSGGQVQAQQYGHELGYILNCITHENTITELDVVSVYGDKDYEVVSIKRYSNHNELELKKR